MVESRLHWAILDSGGPGTGVGNQTAICRKLPQLDYAVQAAREDVLTVSREPGRTDGCAVVGTAERLHAAVGDAVPDTHVAVFGASDKETSIVRPVYLEK